MRVRAPVLLGRGDERDHLRRVLDGARRGAGGAVFVVGEAGVGKSRLVREATVGTDAVVLRGRGSAIGPMAPFRPIVEALLSVSRAGLVPGHDELGPYRDILGRLVPDWGGGAAVGELSLVVLGEAVLRLLAALGRGRGCLLVLDDLHECDAETLAVVEYLADNLDGQPAVLLCTARIEAGRADDLARAAAQRGSATLLELGRLGEADVHAMAAGCLGSPPNPVLLDPAPRPVSSDPSDPRPSDPMPSDPMPSDAVPRPVLDRLWQASLGVPFIVEELLHGMLAGGSLVRGAGGWEVRGPLRAEVPATLARSIAERVERLGPRGRDVLGVAALLGGRVSMEVVQRALDLDDRGLLGHLRGAVAAQLVLVDAEDPGYCSFEHPLTAEALLAQLAPAERAALSARAARAVRALHPDLPGAWCQQAAVLLLGAGDLGGAAALFAEAGRRALTVGAAESAIALLERAERLLAGLPDAAAHAEALESLLFGLAAGGQLDRALKLMDTVDLSGVAGLDAGRRSALHVRFAWVAEISGRLDDAAVQIAEARRALGPDAADRHTAPVDAVAASLALDQPGPDGAKEAERLALRAVAAAERAELPDTLCEALHTVGAVARGRDRDEAAAAYERARVVAHEHRLPLWPTYSAVRLATLDWLFDGDAASTELARRDALRIGAIGIACNLDAVLALHAVLCGRFAEAGSLLARCRVDAGRLRLGRVSRYLTMVAAVHAAHRGRRAELDDALAEFTALGGESAPEAPLALGLAAAFCSLLEEDHERAAVELRRVRRYESRSPTTFHLGGPDGIAVLLAVLAGDGAAEYDRVRASASGRMRWNHQFVLLAGAVLAGRAGRPDAAVAAFDQASQVARPYPMARHLGARLVSAAAARDGWGDPVGWLRAAEEHFHHAGVHAVAGACRAELRRAGAPVPARRTGVERVPDALRGLGITVREYEVGLLLGQRLANREIAARLHLSSRTVEKYVANLMSKTGQTDRHRAGGYVTDLHGPRPSRPLPDSPA